LHFFEKDSQAPREIKRRFIEADLIPQPVEKVFVELREGRMSLRMLGFSEREIKAQKPSETANIEIGCFI